MNASLFLQFIPQPQAAKLQFTYWKYVRRSLKKGTVPASPEAWLKEHLETRASKYRRRPDIQATERIRERFQVLMKG